jgi:hypothetical protein
MASTIGGQSFLFPFHVTSCTKASLEANDSEWEWEVISEGTVGKTLLENVPGRETDKLVVSTTQSESRRALLEDIARSPYIGMASLFCPNLDRSGALYQIRVAGTGTTGALGFIRIAPSGQMNVGFKTQLCRIASLPCVAVDAVSVYKSFSNFLRYLYARFRVNLVEIQLYNCDTKAVCTLYNMPGNTILQQMMMNVNIHHLKKQRRGRPPSRKQNAKPVQTSRIHDYFCGCERCLSCSKFGEVQGRTDKHILQSGFSNLRPTPPNTHWIHGRNKLHILPEKGGYNCSVGTNVHTSRVFGAGKGSKRFGLPLQDFLGDEVTPESLGFTSEFFSQWTEYCLRNNLRLPGVKVKRKRYCQSISHEKIHRSVLCSTASNLPPNSKTKKQMKSKKKKERISYQNSHTERVLSV